MLLLNQSTAKNAFIGGWAFGRYWRTVMVRKHNLSRELPTQVRLLPLPPSLFPFS